MQRQPPPSKIIGNGTTTHSSHDLKALQAAQRRLQNMERDLRPLADRMNTLWTQAKQISEEQPERAEEVQTKVQSLEAMHAELLAQARAWIEQSERSQGQQMFEQAASELLGWTQKCSQQMDLSPSSLPSASEEALRRNAELREQIDGKQFEFGYVEELGQRLIQKGHPKEQVKQRLEELEDAKNELECQWQKREADCRRLLEMQAFTREADRINSLNRGQLAFLDLSSSQADSVEKVQNLLKGQAEFEAKLSAQEERVLSFVASADRLIRTGHSQSTQIENQKREVLYGHQGVIERTQMRRSQLERGLALEGLRRDASELGHWISEKRRQMEQQNEVGGLNWAQTRHQAFMLELPANRAELSRLAKSGATLIRDGIAEREAVANVLEPLEVEWTKLEKLARQRSDLLQQEEQKVSLLEAINEINGKIEEIGNRLSNKTKGKDLRGVKQLINKNVQTGQEIQLLEDRLNEISKKANKMNEKKHSAAPEILERVEVLNVRFNSLHGPLEKMREELEESMGWHQLAFDADVELQWIGEKQLLVECPQLGHSLTEVQQLVKRHEQLTAELDCHQPLVTELLNKGRKLANFDGINGHSCRKEIDAKCLELSNSWTKLMELSAKRRKLLNRTLSREQLLFELSEAENWLSEKNKQLETREEEAISEGHGGAQALFAWLRTFQNELGPFQTSLAELRNKCINLKELGINEEQITERELQIKAQANALEEHARLSAEHADALLNIHNLEEEQQELEQWLEQKSKILSQDDCGGDLEQWEKIQAKFNDERQQIRALGYERLQRLENEANILSKKAPEHAREVLKGQNRLHALWELINEYIEQRESSLAQAEILYRFLRDAEELEERLREKEMTLPNDLGRDAKQSYVLILKHEVFENELAQLREEIEALVASGSQFEQLEENIKLRPLVDSWTRLQEASLHRGEQLMATYETHKFISQVRDLLQWTQSALVEMGGEQTIRDLQTAEWLAEEHRRLRAELEGREQERSLLVNIGRELERAGHCPVEVVHQRLAGLDQAFASVRKEWALKADWLEQAVQWHAFQREAIQILAQIQARDRSLDALEQQREFDKQSKEDKKEKSPAHRKKELNTLVRVLATLEERISRLGEMAETLEEQGHAETEQIQALTRRVMNALNELGEHANSVKRSLDAAEELTQFEAELADLTDWLIEKEESFRTQQATSFISSNDSGQLTNKLERLKRQQALQSELAANTPRLEKLRAHKEKIRNRQRGADVKQALTHCDEFFQRWDQLLAQSKALDAALEEARDLLELEQLADRFGTFLRDKEALVQAEELGGDLEHCQTLINRLKEAHKGVDEKTLIEANILAKKRMINSKGGNSESSHILARLNDINEGWERLSGRIQTYQALLEAALEVHRFNRDVDETNQRIGEKTSILSAEQQAKDLAGVERLLRAQDQAERDMSAIHRKLNEHDEQAKLLLAQEPPLRETVLDSLRKLELSWQRLAELAHARRQALQQAYSLHHFLDLVRRTDQWAQLIRAKMSGQAPSRNVAEAERALQRHAERLAEIGARDDEFRALRELGQRLLQEQPEHRSDLQRAQRRLQTLEHQTRQYWEREQQTLEQSLLFQKILSQIGQIDCWLAGKQAQLDGLTAGESPESAEVAIRELGHFIVALEPQLAERFSWFDSTNKTLDSLTNDYPEGNRVKERVDEIKEKCIELQKQTETKQRNLNANKHLAKFLRECAELITWMNAKLQLAMDDGYLDATALRLKLKKHLAFDAELRASQERVDRLQKRGQYLLNEEFGKDSTEDKEESEERVRAQIQELNNGWNELLAKSAEKTDRLRNAHEAHQLERRIVESECWLERVEAIICSEDHGTDCSSAEQLLEQFEILRTEIRAKGSLIEELCEEASKLVEKTGEDLGTNRQLLCERAEALQARWNAIEEPCQIRAENLSEAVSFYHWADQTDEQLEWLEARVRSLESSDYGRSLHSAQSLLQKHQILEKEFGVRQPAFSQLITTGEKMLLVEMKNNNSNKDNKKEKKQKGPKSDELTERLDKLHDLITLFRALASVREQRLNESLLSQEFYAEAAEAEHWMKERLIPSTNHQQFSHQQESGRQAEAQLRRCLALEKEILTFEDQLKKLGEKCERMVSADHFDLTGLQTRHVQLQELFFQLSSQCHQRKTQTTNAIRYFGFVRRADELLQWLRERLALAEREDYGQDLEECELLAQQFHEVVRELASAGERVAQILTLKEELLREKHPNAGSIRAKGQDVQQLWHEVNEAANERQQALMDGKNIHLFDQKADELLERLAEKEAHLLALSEEQCGGIDLDQMIGQRERLNNEFMLSLNVLSRQVLELCAEADHIVELFPRTSEHLEVRRGELIEQLKDVREGADRQTERLAQSQVNHQYFQEFRELMIWARQMHATITGELLPKEVAGCEALSARHAEFRREISSKEAEKLKITQKGDQMLAQGHNALINEIRSRITTLEEVFTDLLRTWHRRQQIYEDNADLQRWLSSASELERWLTEREQLLAQDWTGLVQDGLEAVEHQIRQFDDFLATLDAQSPQFEALKRLTRLEQNWERLKGQEDRERIAAVNARLQQQQQNRRETQPIRTLEKKKMLQEKRQERERRKTQEISLMGNSAGGIGRQSATGHSIRSSTSAHSGAHMLGQIQQLEPVQSMSTTAFNNSSQTLPRARQRAAGGATSSASSSTSVVVVEGQQTIVPPVSSSRLSIEISQPSSTQQQQNSTPSAPFPVGMRVPPTGRTPGFTTRRTQSIRRSRQWDDLRTVDIHGYLDRKQELQAGGKRATFRSWKSYYSILCGQLLCFFKDEQHFMENMAASAPLALHGSNSALNPEYIKKRFVFKLNTADGAEFLFAAPDQLKALEWVDKINFRAKLDPADQLLAFRPSTSEPLGNPQSRRLPYSSTAADIMSNSRSTTLEPRPKPRELGGNVVNTFKLPNESQKMIKSATLDPRRIGDDKHNYYSSTNQKNEGIEQKIENQQFASQIKIGEEVEEEEKIIVEEEDLENSPNNNCRNNQNGSSHIFEDTISVRSGMGGTIKSKKITSGAFAFLRRSSAVIGGKKSACENSLDLN